MDELVGLVAERIAAQIRKSREVDAAAPLSTAERARRQVSPVSGASAPAPATASVAAASRASANPFASGSNALSSSTPIPNPKPSPPPPSRPAAQRQARVNLDDAFPTTLDAAPAARVVPASALLAAFAGGTSLLGAIVLAEALAPPVALRHEPPHRP